MSHSSSVCITLSYLFDYYLLTATSSGTATTEDLLGFACTIFLVGILMSFMSRMRIRTILRHLKTVCRMIVVLTYESQYNYARDIIPPLASGRQTRQCPMADAGSAQSPRGTNRLTEQVLLAPCRLPPIQPLPCTDVPLVPSSTLLVSSVDAVYYFHYLLSFGFSVLRTGRAHA